MARRAEESQAGRQGRRRGIQVMSGASQAMSLDPHAVQHLHHELGFWRKYVFSVDHKVIGIQYTLTALCFLLFGFSLMWVMRWQLAYPNQPIPIVGGLLRALWGDKVTTSDFALSGDGYNAFGAMHGTIMVFLGIVPLAVGGFG